MLPKTPSISLLLANRRNAISSLIWVFPKRKLQWYIKGVTRRLKTLILRKKKQRYAKNTDSLIVLC